MTYNIITLGCKVNQYESNFIEESLVSNGFSFTSAENSDVVIINTCTVTDTSDKKCLKTVRHVKRVNPDAILVVMGCSVQYDASKYDTEDVDILIGNREKSKVVSLLQNYIKSKNKYKFIDNNRCIPFENMYISKFNQVRCYIKVQDGCNNFCSYCVIPYVRGDIRSKNFDLILDETKCLVNNGFKEIVLTGIHTGSYNDNGKDLTDLINAMSNINGIERIRISSVEVTELNDKFLDTLKNNKVICNHMHIPLQSGSDEILKKMNRKYDTKYYEDKINLIRSIRPDISITTDVIVGFNYETDELFNKCYDFCKKMNFSKIHVFPYSERKGTAASYMDGKVNESVKHDRCKKLIGLSNILEKEYYDKHINTYDDILIEEVKDGKSIGHTSNYLRVVLDEVLDVNRVYNRMIK